MSGNRTIWKFPIAIGEITEIELPRLARVGMAGLDPATGSPAIWVELDPEAPRVTRRFLIYGTGHPIEGDGGYASDLYVGSLMDRAFVWHVYERREAH